MLPLFDRLKTWWTTAERQQRIVTLAGIGALVLLLVGTAIFVTRTRYATLVENLTDTQQSEVVDALAAVSIPAQYSRRGTVEVPEDMVLTARLKLASAGKLPEGAMHPDFKELANGTFEDPKVMEARLKAVQEGEIARTLEAMEGVASARVIVTRPENRLFATEQKAPTASVTLVEDGRGTLTRENGRTIANLVCASVEGLKPDGVVVVSNTLGKLWDGHDGEGGGSKWDLDTKVARDMEAKIQQALDVPFGMGNTKVIVRADVNTDESQEHVRQVDPTGKPIASQVGSESMDRAGRIASGPAGTASNTETRALASPPADADGKGKYERKDAVKQFDANETVRDTVRGSGNLRELAITVIANSDKISDATKVKEIVDGVMGGRIELDANGAPVRNQPFTTSVTSVKFDGSADLAAKEAADRAASQQRMQQILSLLPIGAILVVALLVAKQVGRISKAVLPAPAEMDVEPTEEEPGVLAEDGGPDALPAPGEDGAASEEPSLMLEPFLGPVNVPLESLKKMAEERPELVATLIKSVMLGERG